MEQQPGGLAQPAGQMSHSRVHCDDEITVHHDGSILYKIPRLVDFLLTTNKSIQESTICQLLGTKTLLQRQETGIYSLNDGGKGFQGKGPTSQIRPLVLGVALPTDADDGLFSEDNFCFQNKMFSFGALI